jgi:hypothetical protein
MKIDNMNKLNQCLDILDSTDLGLSVVWLWTWSVIKDNLENGDFEQKVSEQTAWEELCKAVESGEGFTLEYGSEQHAEHVLDWMITNGLIEEFED